MARTFLLLVLVLPGAAGAAAGRPSFLWLSLEDTSTQLGAYGDRGAVTPHIDALARDGIRFANAYATAPVCAVSRSALITGVYAVALGAQFMRTDILRPEQIKPFPWYLRQAGYFTTNRKKTDYQFEAPPDTWDLDGAGHRDWEERTDPGQPFFSVINYSGTHESRNRGEYAAALFDPEALDLPPYYPDTPTVRRFWAGYYQNVHEADAWIGEQLARLEATGAADDTVVMIWADHGPGLPRGKRWIFDLGLRVPLIVHVPAKWRERFVIGDGNEVRLDPVSLIDLAPTVLSLAGVDVPGHMQGRVLLGPRRQEPASGVFAHRDRMDERIDIIRTVIGSRYKYVRNYEYFKPRLQHQEYAEAHPWSGITAELRRLEAASSPDPAVRWYFQYKPIEELYDLERDPFELENLASDPAYAGVLASMRGELWSMQQRIGDLGAVPESLLRKWRVEQGSEYALRGTDRVREAWSVLRRLHTLSAEELAGLSRGDNAAVRYWAAVGLGNFAADEARRDALAQALTPLLEDEEPVVRAAAARGLLLAGDSPPALEVLGAIIEDAALDPADHLAAMLAIDLAGRRALPIRPLLERVRFEEKYPDRVRRELLARIETAEARTPPLLHPR